ncbi:MAG: (Fe-S)-binding protein [Dehalococcoidales bacterium]|nr:(Fe-S)-binding protein [Dehalococcoidales bacterium]
MNWEEYEHDMQRCPRCSYCKYIPWRFIKNFEFMEGCPAAARYHWHAYAAGGKYNLSYSLMKERIEIDDTFLDIVYKCLMDGSCDISCKVGNDLEPLQHMQELRIKCVDEGYMLPQHLPYIRNLREEDNMMLKPRLERGDWAEGLDVKRVTEESAEVLFFAGCRYSYDKELWPVARAGLDLIQKAGVDVGILGVDESCCGGRAYELGYEGELTKFAEHQTEMLKSSGVKVLVTPCADCYSTFKVLYDKIGKKPEIEIYHITQYLEKLILEGKLVLKKEVPLKVTYHDPCHLGRLAEPWIHWNGKEYKPEGSLTWLHDPPKKYRRGTNGVYDTPRNIIKSVPGVDFTEMYRIREYAWCCGAGGGVIDAYPDFAAWTGVERLREARSTGAEALVTACPWCKRNFLDAAEQTGDSIEILDIVELIQRAL